MCTSDYRHINTYVNDGVKTDFQTGMNATQQLYGRLMNLSIRLYIVYRLTINITSNNSLFFLCRSHFVDEGSGGGHVGLASRPAEPDLGSRKLHVWPGRYNRYFIKSP